jgi:hypothetical protein
MGSWINTIAGLLISAAFGALFVKHALHVDRKVRVHGLLYGAGATATQAVATFLAGVLPVSAMNAAITVWLLWVWWNNGGGDGFKRLVKRAAGYLGFGPQALPQGV